MAVWPKSLSLSIKMTEEYGKIMPIHVQKADTMALPNWVPPDVQNYLLHTETGLAIRYLARQKGCHASTVMRQIRRLEHLRY